MHELQLDAVYSRPIAAAARLGESAPDRHRFVGKRVLLTGDAAVLATANGRVMALMALRLLPRLTPNVTVWMPGAPAPLLEELQREAQRVAFGGAIEVSAGDDGIAEVPLTGVDAVLSIGRAPDRVGEDLGTRVTVASNGWCAWVSRGDLSENVATAQANPVGATFAASLGCAEVFKVLMPLRADRGAPADGAPFSVLTYRAGDRAPGPVLPETIAIDALIVGFGAIGNGIVATLSELPLRGRVVVVDRQRFEVENLGTCVLIGPRDLGSDKVAIAAGALAHLGPALSVETIVGEAEHVLPGVRPVPAVVMNGLDNPNARREAQRLWADHTIDGAIGDFMCQVSRHPGDGGEDIACLRCLFAEEAGPRAELVSAAATGLRPERVLQPDDVVRDDDVAAAPAYQQETLRASVGQLIGKVTCSVSSERLTQAISEVSQPQGFEPSVPFVATLSAAMVVGEWVKAAMGLESTLAPRYQFDVLHGPAGGLEFPESRHADCQCVQRRSVIERLRSARVERGVA